ncbi:PspC domain-containing protein [Aeromicrobium sp. SMF47]|nr:PspC domain-containing protein [Aeromicrobium yanjiei]
MPRGAGLRHDGDMTDSQPPPAPGPQPGARDDEFDPHRLRTIIDMKRSQDDRVVAGVCAGAARYLRIDPVVVRVAIVVLTVAGFAGVILYVAAWVLLPSEGSDRSLAAEWFNLDRNEEQVRVAGLLVAVVLASLALVGDTSWSWWDGSPWWLLPVALVVWVFYLGPRRRREERERLEQPATVHAPGGAAEPAATRRFQRQTAGTPRDRRSQALLGLTMSCVAIAVAVTVIYDVTQESVPRTTYIAVALTVVAMGLLVGAFFGNSGGLIAIGALLAIALTIGSLLPNGRIGAQQPTPVTAAAVDAHYRHGVGLLEVDLSQVADPQALVGRRIVIHAGIGHTKVVVPDGLAVRVDADLRAGEITLFGLTDNGTDVSLETGALDRSAALTIDIAQKLGNIEVIRE